MNDVEQGIKVELAAFKGEVITELKHLGHDVRNLTQGMQLFVTRREVDDIHQRRKEAHEDLEDRVDNLEKNQSRAAWAIILAWIGGLGVTLKVWAGH